MENYSIVTDFIKKHADGETRFLEVGLRKLKDGTYRLVFSLDGVTEQIECIVNDYLALYNSAFEFFDSYTFEQSTTKN